MESNLRKERFHKNEKLCRLSFIACVAPVISLIPGQTSLQDPAQYRRAQDFYISSNIIVACSISSSISIEWSIFNCTNSCVNRLSIDQNILTTTQSELYVPARTLNLGVYELKLFVAMLAAPELNVSISAFVRINPSGITANLVPLGTSIVTSGQSMNLTLGPGSFSVDPDSQIFNASVSHLTLISTI